MTEHHSKDDIHLRALSHVEDSADKSISGIAQHLPQTKTPEEVKAEKRFVRRVDFIILPLLASMYFLAQLVKIIPHPKGVLGPC